MKKVALTLAALILSANVSAETILCPQGPIPYNPSQSTQVQARGVWWGIWGTPGNQPNTFYLAGALGNKNVASSGTCVYTLNGQMPNGNAPDLLLSSYNPLIPDAGNWSFSGNTGECTTDPQSCAFNTQSN